MGLHIFELSKELSGCGPEARFLLEAMVLLEQRTSAGEAARSAKLLAKQLGLAEKLIKDALAELTSAQLVVVHDASSGRRGRPAIRYELASTVLTALPKREGVYGVHADLLVRLFSAGAVKIGKAPTRTEKEPRVQKDGKRAPSGAAGYLSACNRLLLATLLAHADQLGMVGGVSRERLSRLTGLGALSLKYHLQRLTSLGLIHFCMPGLSSSVFPGAKVSSTYFLNLSKFLLAAPKVGFNVRFQTCDGEGMYLSQEQINGGSRANASIKRFLSGERRAVFDVLRFMLFKHASHVVSRYRQVLKPGNPVNNDLRQEISGDLRRPLRWKDGREVLDDEWDVIIDHFYLLAVRVAAAFARRYETLPTQGVDFEAVAIIPAGPNLQLVIWLLRAETVWEGGPLAF